MCSKWRSVAYCTYSRNIGVVSPRIPRGRQFSAYLYSNSYSLFNQVDDVSLELRNPKMRICLFDAVDEVDAKFVCTVSSRKYDDSSVTSIEEMSEILQ